MVDLNIITAITNGDLNSVEMSLICSEYEEKDLLYLTKKCKNGERVLKEFLISSIAKYQKVSTGFIDFLKNEYSIISDINSLYLCNYRSNKVSLDNLIIKRGFSIDECNYLYFFVNDCSGYLSGFDINTGFTIYSYPKDLSQRSIFKIDTKEIVSIISIGNGAIDIIVNGIPNIKKVWRKV